MIKSVAFVSRRQIEKVVIVSNDTAVISITDPINTPMDKPARISAGFHSVIRLAFHDLYEECLGEKVGAIPDLHNDHKAGRKLFYSGYEICDYNDAKKIFVYTERLHTLKEDVHLIVHCEAGVSRSAAVAKFISERHNVPIDQANDDTSAANKRLIRLLEKASDPSAIITAGTIIETVADKKHWDKEIEYVSRPLGIF